MTANKIRIIIVTIVSLLAVVVVLQNREPVETRLLFATVTMPRALLLFVTLLLGFALGSGTAAYLVKRRKKGNE